MRSRARRRRAPLRIFWPALAVSAVLVYVVLDAWTWYRLSYPMPASWQPPGELGLTSMPALALIASVAVCVFLIARWDRGQERRHDSFALVALGLMVLSQLLIAQAALAGLDAGAMIPHLQAVTQARWVLIAAALVGAVALVNIVRSRPRNRGALFAIVALIGAPCTFPILSLVETEPFEPRIDDELELASSSSAPISLQFFGEPPSPVLDVLANGEFRLASSLAGSPQRFDDAELLRETLQKCIAPLPHVEGAPDVPLIVRIDRAAEFRHVSAALRIASEMRLWRVSALIARTGHDVQGRLMLWLPLDSSDGPTTYIDGTRKLHLASHGGEPRFDWDGDQLDLEATAARLRNETEPVRLVPDEDVAWAWIVEALVKLSDPMGVQAFATEFTLRIGD